LRPGAIIRNLNLLQPMYEPTAAYGHFGRTDLDLPWERTDRTEALKSAAGDCQVGRRAWPSRGPVAGVGASRCPAAETRRSLLPHPGPDGPRAGPPPPACQPALPSIRAATSLIHSSDQVSSPDRSCAMTCSTQRSSA